MDNIPNEWREQFTENENIEIGQVKYFNGEEFVAAEMTVAGRATRFLVYDRNGEQNTAVLECVHEEFLMGIHAIGSINGILYYNWNNAIIQLTDSNQINILDAFSDNYYMDKVEQGGKVVDEARAIAEENELMLAQLLDAFISKYVNEYMIGRMLLVFLEGKVISSTAEIIEKKLYVKKIDREISGLIFEKDEGLCEIFDKFYENFEMLRELVSKKIGLNDRNKELVTYMLLWRGLKRFMLHNWNTKYGDLFEVIPKTVASYVKVFKKITDIDTNSILEQDKLTIFMFAKDVFSESVLNPWSYAQDEVEKEIEQESTENSLSDFEQSLFSGCLKN